MTVNHKEQLNNFLNGLIAKGKTPAEVEAIRVVLMADDNVVQYFSGGTLAQNLLDQKLNEARQLEEQMRRQQGEWNQYIQRATQTVSQAEQARLTEATRAAAAETALRAIASQYNIPESELSAIYNFQQTQQQQQPTQQQQQPVNQFQQQQPQQPRQGQEPTNSVTREELLGVLNDLALKDSLASRHFILTGKPWDSSRALSYMKQQASLGQQVELEQAWRITENIDSLEATAAQAARDAERAQIRLEIEQELAQRNNTTPLDAQPQFQEAHLSSILNPAALPEGQQPERTGHRARTNAALEALHKVQNARRLGQPSPYETSP